MNRETIQPIRSVPIETARYRYIVEKNPPLHKEPWKYNAELRFEKPLVFRIQVGLWCKAVTGHKLDTDRSVAKSNGEICHPCIYCRALIGTGIYTQTIITNSEKPLVTLT